MRLGVLFNPSFQYGCYLFRHVIESSHLIIEEGAVHNLTHPLQILNCKCYRHFEPLILRIATESTVYLVLPFQFGLMGIVIIEDEFAFANPLPS